MMMKTIIVLISFLALRMFVIEARSSSRDIRPK
jgi:hypothetical protein